MLRFFAAPKQGTPTWKVEQDSIMMLMETRVLLKKMLFIGKIMSKEDPTKCVKEPYQEGGQLAKERTNAREFISFSNKLNIPDVSEGCLDK